MQVHAVCMGVSTVSERSVDRTEKKCSRIRIPSMISSPKVCQYNLQSRFKTHLLKVFVSCIRVNMNDKQEQSVPLIRIVLVASANQ